MWPVTYIYIYSIYNCQHSLIYKNILSDTLQFALFTELFFCVNLLVVLLQGDFAQGSQPTSGANGVLIASTIKGMTPTCMVWIDCMILISDLGWYVVSVSNVGLTTLFIASCVCFCIFVVPVYADWPKSIFYNKKFYFAAQKVTIPKEKWSSNHHFFRSY